ncbi:MAG: hypothetical protein M1833_005652 [Piccolia ochrophora]|nr:MAG: hypothetical protein M1833_005652 [Piccolia ochrophora]
MNGFEITYDFSGYLSRIDPLQSYTIEPLKGGLTNFTVRAIKTTSRSTDEGRFPNHKTLVLKNAPPHAAQSEELPLSQHRQVNESRALSLFTPPDGLLPHLCRDSDVSVPHLLEFDQDEHVLIMSDLGDSVTFTEYLSLTQGDDKADCLRSSFLTSADASFQLGSRLGRFLGELHSRRTLDLIGRDRLAMFGNPDYVTIFHILNTELTRVLGEFGAADAVELAQRVLVDFHRDDVDEERSFQLGDLWVGGILVSKLDDTWLRLGAVDWEHAGAGRGVSGDVSQLLANAHLCLLESASTGTLHAAIRAAIDGLTQAYRTRRRVDEMEWTRAGKLVSSGATPPAPEASSTLARMVRSAYLGHGNVMLLRTLLLGDWRCTACKKADAKNCEMVPKMIERGLWYLRTARNDTAEFVEEGNWKLVCSEENWVVGSLFYGD